MSLKNLPHFYHCQFRDLRKKMSLIFNTLLNTKLVFLQRWSGKGNYISSKADLMYWKRHILFFKWNFPIFAVDFVAFFRTRSITTYTYVFVHDLKWSCFLILIFRVLKDKPCIFYQPQTTTFWSRPSKRKRFGFEIVLLCFIRNAFWKHSFNFF